MINKQEAIETLQSKAVNHYSETRGWTKRVELDLAIDIINQFNEPEKPVVPQFLADWYENNKNDIENSIYKLCIDFYLETLDEKLHDWFGDPKNKPIETIRNMKFYGYEVEKEKLYTARLKLISRKNYSYINKNKDLGNLLLGNLKEMSGKKEKNK